VWCMVWLVVLFRVAVRGVGARERRFVLSVLVAALAIRVLMVAALFLFSDHTHTVSFFWDGDGVYIKQRALAIRLHWLGMPVPPTGRFSPAWTFFLGYGWSSYLFVIAYLQWLLGPSPFAVHLVNIALFLTGAVALYRLARAGYGPVPAAAGLALLCLLPTLIAWSVGALKESFYFLLSALGVIAAVRLMHAARFRAVIGWSVAVVASILAIGTVREGGVLIAGIGLAGGVITAALIRRPALLMVAAVLVPLVAWQALQQPAVHARVMEQFRVAAVRHMGNVSTPGHSYKLLDSRFYAGDRASSSLADGEAVRFLIRAITAYIAVPVPWDIQSKVELVFLAQQAAWYVMVIFACVGLFAGLGRDAALTMILASFAIVASGVIAINSGNVGTMVRFRDTVVPFVVWLSAVGGVVTMRWVSAWHAGGAPLGGARTGSPTWATGA
jgi:hypothetical protein